jgi:hypothetical protein
LGFSAAVAGLAAGAGGSTAAACSGGAWYPFIKSGGTPVSAPGTPLGNNGSRSPEIFFLVLNMSLDNISVGSN